MEQTSRDLNDRRPSADDRALERFDALPNTAAVSLKVASDIAGFSISTYRRGARAGTMPPIVKLSPGRSGVIVGPLRQSLRDRKEAA